MEQKTDSKEEREGGINVGKEEKRKREGLHVEWHRKMSRHVGG